MKQITDKIAKLRIEREKIDAKINVLKEILEEEGSYEITEEVLVPVNLAPKKQEPKKNQMKGRTPSKDPYGKGKITKSTDADGRSIVIEEEEI